MATYTVTGLAEVIFKFNQQAAQSFNSTFSGTPSRDFARSFASTDITKLFFNTYSVTTSPTSIDLTSLTDAFGQPVNFTGTIKSLYVANNDGTNNLTVGGGTNGLFSTLPFTLNGQTISGSTQNGSVLSLVTPITVDATHKILTLVSSAGTISVDVFVVGI